MIDNINQQVLAQCQQNLAATLLNYEGIVNSRAAVVSECEIFYWHVSWRINSLGCPFQLNLNIGENPMTSNSYGPGYGGASGNRRGEKRDPSCDYCPIPR